MTYPPEHWDGIAVDFGSADAIGLVPVSYPKTPSWFNEQIDRLKFRAAGRAFRITQIDSGAVGPDICCGPGRTVCQFQKLGLKTMVLDAAQETLWLTVQRGINVCLLRAEAHRLPLADQAFGCVMDMNRAIHKAQPPARRDR